MYSQTNLAVGVGKTLATATKDANAAIPKGTKNDYYEAESNFNGPQYQCINGAIWNKKDECGGNEVQYAIEAYRENPIPGAAYLEKDLCSG